MNKEQQILRDHIRQLLKEIYECNDYGHHDHKIIQKESQTFKEHDEDDQAQAWGEYAVGTLLDMERQKRAEFELTSLYMNAMTDAMGDMGDDDEARETVNLALQTMFDAWLEKQQPKSRGSR